MAALLEPGGVVASFGGPVLAADPAVLAAVAAALPARVEIVADLTAHLARRV